jgi:hypothetical protein
VTNTVDTMTVEPVIAVSFACPQPALGVKGLLPAPAAAVVDVPQWAAAWLRPSSRQRAALSRITATGVGYGFGSDLAAGTSGARRGTATADAAEQVGKRPNGSTVSSTRTTQRKQLHLMSRRDPQTWRPPV